MYNPVLRTCLETFLEIFTAFLSSIRMIDPKSTEGSVDLIFAILIGVYSLILTIFSARFL